MPHEPRRVSASRRLRPAAILALSLALAGGAQAADPPRVRRAAAAPPPLELRVMPPAPAVDPEAGLGVLQRLALLLERIFADRTPAQADAIPATPAPMATIVVYSGPLAAGTVVINLDRLQAYRILEGGFAELYQEQSEAAVLSRVGMARRSGA